MSKNFLTNDKHRAFNEIVFENRNKAYGAYALRTEANVLLQRAFFIGMAFFATMALVPLVINKLKQKPVIIEQQGPYIFENVDRPEKYIEKPQQQIVKPRPAEKTQSLEPPTPTVHPKVETTVNPKVDDALISDRDRTGIPVENQNSTNILPGDGAVKADETPKVDPNAIPEVVDSEPGFVGGIETFRNKVLQNFDTGAVESESGEIIRGIITFIVEKDGTITNIKANSSNQDFNKEAEKTIKNIKGKWMPAKLKGQAVRSYFRFPISMQFD